MNDNAQPSAVGGHARELRPRRPVVLIPAQPDWWLTYPVGEFPAGTYRRVRTPIVAWQEVTGEDKGGPWTGIVALIPGDAGWLVRSDEELRDSFQYAYIWTPAGGRCHCGASPDLRDSDDPYWCESYAGLIDNSA